MDPLTAAVLRSGLITPGQLEEIKRFRPPNLDSDAQVSAPVPLEEAAARIALVLQSEGFVLVRETDLEAVHQYLADSYEGRIVFFAEDDQEEVDVRYSRTPLGEFVIPWSGDTLEEFLTNPSSYLQTVDGDRVRIASVRELFLGKQKVFMVLTPERSS